MNNNSSSEGNVNSIETYLNRLPRIEEKSNGHLYYRGQGNAQYELQPSIFRGNYLGREHLIYSEIMTECGHEFENCISHNEKLSKMQHYGVPTRLLDITSNALVALYFACENFTEEEDGAVFVIDAKKSNIKQFDSDTVSILSSLPRFTREEKLEMKELARNLVAVSSDNGEISMKDIEQFNDDKHIRRLLHEIKKEKPAFEHVIQPISLLSNHIFIPRKNNARIIRQSGAFIIYGLSEDENANDFENRGKIIIDSESKESILKQLSSLGITKASIYPELYKVAEHLKEKYK